MRPLVAAIVTAAVATALTQAGRSLEGRLVDERGQPVRGATVIVVQQGDSPRLASISDEHGRFTIRGIQALRAKVVVEAGPLILQRPVAGELPDVAAILEPGKVASPLAVTLVRGAAVAGTVFSGGSPQANIRVTATRKVLATDGKEFVRTTRTSTTGAYRFAGLPEGAYVISAADTGVAGGPVVAHTAATIDQAFDALALRAPFVSVSPAVTATASVPTFYPGTTVISEAQHIPIRAGTEQEGIDITLSGESPASLTGIVRDPTGQPITKGRLLLFFVGHGDTAFARMIPLLLDSQGRFSASGLLPGTYRLIGETAPGDQQAGLAAERTFDLRPAERMDLDLLVRPPTRLAITVASGAIALGELEKYSVRLERIGYSKRLAPFDDVERRIVSARAEFPSVLPGAYRVSVRGGAGVVVARVSSGGTAHADELTVAAVQVQTSDLWVTRSGTVEGRIVACEAGAAVVLFSRDENEWMTQSATTRTVAAQTDCSFSIADVIPGAYWISALASQAPSANQSTFLKSLLASAMRVDVSSATNVAVTLPHRQ